MDHLFKASMAAGVLLAGGSIFYHQAVHVPGVERAGALQAPQLQRLEQRAAQAELEHCHQAARMFHDVRWAAACMSVAAQEDARHAACLQDPAVINDPARGRRHCDALHGQTDGSPECSLPDARAASINASLNEAEQKCALEARRASR